MKAELIAQYQKALLMLIDCIRQCPQELWNDTTYENAFWRITYHTQNAQHLGWAAGIRDSTRGYGALPYRWLVAIPEGVR
ncbi:hypothetical protein [Mucilaginibacter sp. KACC 22063]|uniref:hypothetical protein n=1 Tax=Mucilaginibacter sp. KACC 22063 TaxID=3025666 RepID=UPI00236570CD|nr:hypothetical protein [Mucilaginibacter sp. KACC 22063]WDF54488.1 hypothetical protein PQ461_16245 [Mucilaginibacter sp. KACC 22063]